MHVGRRVTPVVHQLVGGSVVGVFGTCRHRPSPIQAGAKYRERIGRLHTSGCARSGDHAFLSHDRRHCPLGRTLLLGGLRARRSAITLDQGELTRPDMFATGRAGRRFGDDLPTDEIGPAELSHRSQQVNSAKLIRIQTCPEQLDPPGRHIRTRQVQRHAIGKALRRRVRRPLSRYLHRRLDQGVIAPQAVPCLLVGEVRPANQITPRLEQRMGGLDHPIDHR